MFTSSAERLRVVTAQRESLLAENHLIKGLLSRAINGSWVHVAAGHDLLKERRPTTKYNDAVLLLSSEFLHLHNETIRLGLAEAIKEGVKIGRLSAQLLMRENTIPAQDFKVVPAHALSNQALTSTRVSSRNIAGQLTDRTFQANPKARIANVSCAGASFNMFVHDPAECIYISQGLLSGGWECEIITEIVDILKRKPDGERGYFMDVGSNIGSFSLTVAHSGFNVVAFEAMTYNVELQQASVGTFPPGGNLNLFHTAVTSVDGEKMCIGAAKFSPGGPKINAGNGQLTRECEASSEHVSLRSIDSILADEKLGAACFSVIKADVEGFESLAFEGALKIFTGKCPPCAVFFEYNKEYTVIATNDERAPFNFLSSHGYSCEVISAADYRCKLTASQYAARCGGA